MGVRDRAEYAISPNELATRLRFLINQGVISRRVQAGPPAVTNYELTDKGQALQDVLHAVAKYQSIVSE